MYNDDDALGADGDGQFLQLLFRCVIVGATVLFTLVLATVVLPIYFAIKLNRRSSAGRKKLNQLMAEGKSVPLELLERINH